jgi:hypothetical protein
MHCRHLSRRSSASSQPARGRKLSLTFTALQIKRPHQKDRHLCARHLRRRAVITPATAQRDLPHRHLVYKRIERIARRHIQEPLHCRRRRIEIAQATNDKRRHLFARHVGIGAIVAPVPPWVEVGVALLVCAPDVLLVTLTVTTQGLVVETVAPLMLTEVEPAVKPVVVGLPQLLVVRLGVPAIQFPV